MPRYLTRVTNGTHFVVSRCRRDLLRRHGMTCIWRCSCKKSLGTLSCSSVAFQHCDAFPVVDVIVLPQPNTSVIAGTCKNRAHHVPANTPDCAIMVVEMSDHGYFKSGQTIWRHIPKTVK